MPRVKLLISTIGELSFISQDTAARRCAPLEPQYEPHGQLSILAFNSEIISRGLKCQVDRTRSIITIVYLNAYRTERYLSRYIKEQPHVCHFPSPEADYHAFRKRY